MFNAAMEQRKLSRSLGSYSNWNDRFRPLSFALVQASIGRRLPVTAVVSLSK
jgi:hypothetical protein